MQDRSKGWNFRNVSPEEQERRNEAQRLRWASYSPEEKFRRLEESSRLSAEAVRRPEVQVRRVASLARWRREHPEKVTEYVRSGILSSESRVKAQESIRRRWDGMSEEERREWYWRFHVPYENSESLRRYWGGLSEDEKGESLERSMLSPEGKRNAVESGRATTLRAFWAGLSREERLERVRESFLSEEGVLASRRSCASPPSHPELVMGAYLEREFPGKWRYNGDGKNGVIVGGKVPDFVNVGGEKEVVEVFGSYWHGEDEIEEKVEHYKKFGYGCTVVWDYECFLPQVLDEKFCGTGRGRVEGGK